MHRCFEATSGLFLGLVVLDCQVDQGHKCHDLTQLGIRYQPGTIPSANVIGAANRRIVAPECS